MYGNDAVSARDLIFLCNKEVYVQVRVVISRADLYPLVQCTVVASEIRHLA